MSLQEKQSILSWLDAEILKLVDEESVAEEIQQADSFRKEVYAVMVKLDRHSIRSSPSVALDSSAGHSLTQSDPPSHDNKLKFPKLTIHPFEGKITTWTTFRDSYQAAIDHNSSLSHINKFNYLRSLLQESALDAIVGLTLTAAN